MNHSDVVSWNVLRGRGAHWHSLVWVESLGGVGHQISRRGSNWRGVWALGWWCLQSRIWSWFLFNRWLLVHRKKLTVLSQSNAVFTSSFRIIWRYKTSDLSSSTVHCKGISNMARCEYPILERRVCLFPPDRHTSHCENDGQRKATSKKGWWVLGMYYWPHATEVRWYPNLLRFLSFASMALCEFAVDAIWSTAMGIAPTSTVLSRCRSKVHQRPWRSERRALWSSWVRVPRGVIKGECDRNPRRAIQTPQREYDRGVPPENDAASIPEF